MTIIAQLVQWLGLIVITLALLPASLEVFSSFRSPAKYNIGTKYKQITYLFLLYSKANITATAAGSLGTHKQDVYLQEYSSGLAPVPKAQQTPLAELWKK